MKETTLINPSLSKPTVTKSCPILGFAAWSGTGKTTLLTKLIPLLRLKGIRLGLIKHAHHEFDIDIPGKDSYELRKAGAEQVMVASSQRWALITEQKKETDDLDLDHLLYKLEQTYLNLILVEGFRHDRLPKIELFRPELNKPPLYPEDKLIIAVATKQADSIHFQHNKDKIPILDLDNSQQIVDFIITYFNLPTK